MWLVTECQVWGFQLRAWLIFLPCSSSWFPFHVQIHVFISNKASSHCDKFCCCSDAHTESGQLPAPSADSSVCRTPLLSLSPSPGDKRPHPCHRSVAAINYHCSLSHSLLASLSPSTSLSFYFLFSSHPISLSIRIQGDKSLMSLLQCAMLFFILYSNSETCRLKAKIITAGAIYLHAFHKLLVWQDGSND